MGWRKFFKKVLSAAGPQGWMLNQLIPGERGGVGNVGSSPDPYSIEWDPTTGMPIGLTGPPSAEDALRYQYRSQELVNQRRQALWGDAQQALRQSENLLTSYRPGGSAALASGIGGQRASMFANQALALNEPDLLYNYRERDKLRAQQEASEARDWDRMMGLFSIGTSLVGMGAGIPSLPGVGGGPSARSGGGQGGPNIASMGTPYPGGYSPSGGPGSYSISPGGGMARMPGGGGSQAQIPQGGMGAGTTLAAGMDGGGAGPGMARQPGRGGPGAGAAAGGPGAPPGGGGPMGGPLSGSFGLSGDFGSASLAQSSVSPFLSGFLRMSVAQNPQYRATTKFMRSSARTRLFAAMEV